MSGLASTSVNSLFYAEHLPSHLLHEFGVRHAAQTDRFFFERRSCELSKDERKLLVDMVVLAGGIEEIERPYRHAPPAHRNVQHTLAADRPQNLILREHRFDVLARRANQNLAALKNLLRPT